MKLFTLEYNYHNPNFDILSLININIHKLLLEVNKDIIETIDIQPCPDDASEHTILYKFKDIGGDFGNGEVDIHATASVALTLALNRACAGASLPQSCNFWCGLP